MPRAGMRHEGETIKMELNQQPGSLKEDILC